MSPIRHACVTAGSAMLTMAVVAPLGLLVALPDGRLGTAALTVLVVGTLDIVVAVALLPLLAPGARLMAHTSAALRVAYAAVFVSATSHLVGPDPDVDRFQATWDVALWIFGLHLLAVTAAGWRSEALPRTVCALVAVAGVGYLIDSAAVVTGADWPSIGALTFIGEVALLVWLLTVGGRAPARHTVMAH